ncbi:hypothetical protein FVI09_03455 [Escherichia coli]|nr:hypothetical protein [Escherichia coli]
MSPFSYHRSKFNQLFDRLLQSMPSIHHLYYLLQELRRSKCCQLMDTYLQVQHLCSRLICLLQDR